METHFLHGLKTALLIGSYFAVSTFVVANEDLSGAGTRGSGDDFAQSTPKAAHIDCKEKPRTPPRPGFPKKPDDRTVVTQTVNCSQPSASSEACGRQMGEVRAGQLMLEKAQSELKSGATERFDKLEGLLLKECPSPAGSLEPRIWGWTVKEWLERAAWFSALIAAFIAALSFRKNVYQSRATTILAIQKQFDELGDNVKAFAALRDAAVRLKAEHQNSKSPQGVLNLVRDECNKHVSKAQDENPELYRRYMKCLTFFEKIGFMVRHRYIPLRDIVSLYKGPILEMDELFGSHIKTLQAANTEAEGVFENAVFLVGETQRYEAAPPRKRKLRAIKDWF